MSRLVPSESSQVVTFYSYKGGTGRSMALANYACYLAQQPKFRGKRILIVDWDLEAPGLHRYFPEANKYAQGAGPAGVIELFVQIKSKFDDDKSLYADLQGPEGLSVLEGVARLEDFLVPDVFSRVASVDMLRAGRFGPGFAESVNTFPWIDFFKAYSGVFGRLRDLIATRYEVCLIDSRTGLTDTSGICTMLMPEKLVAVFTPNVQSLEGVIDLLKESLEYRASSSDFRPLSIFPLPSRIENVQRLQEAWRIRYQQAFEELFKTNVGGEQLDLTAYFNSVLLPHKSDYAFGETIAITEEKFSENGSLRKAYESFFEILTNGDTAWDVGNTREADPSIVAEPVTVDQSVPRVGDKSLGTSTESLPDPTPYFNYLRSETGHIRIAGLKTGPAYRYPVDRLFINLRNHEDEDLEQALSAHRCLVIKGDAGSGKSTFLRHIAFTALGDPQRFPIYIRIRDLEEYISKLSQQNPQGAPPSREDPRWLAYYLAHQPQWADSNLDQEFFEKALHQPTTVVLLDGLDETLDEASRRRMADLISNAAGHTYKRCRFVVTTRPTAYIGDARLPDFNVQYIAPLSGESIRSFLSAWSDCLYPENPTEAARYAQELLAQVNAHPEIRNSVATTPVMLTALAAIHYNERRLPDDRADLYKSILYWLAGSRERKPGRRRDKECIKLLALLAFGMQTHAGGRLAQAERSVAATLLESKIPDRHTAIEFLEEEELDSGILLSRGSNVEFLHLSFQEYLAATHMEGLREQDCAAVVLQGHHRYSPEWRAFISFFAAALSESRFQGFLSLLLDHAGPTLSGRAMTLALVAILLKERKGFKVEDPQYLRFAKDLLVLFEPASESQGIDGWTRGTAAVVWERLEDYSRRRRPSDHDYWVNIGPFQIGQVPVTVWEYEFFVNAGGPVPHEWPEQLRFKNRPVVWVSWHEAIAYCQWMNCRLLSAEEWTLAALGPEQRRYPWGNVPPSPDRANFLETGIAHGSPVGLFPAGATPEGVLDMAGNVWEWTASDDGRDGKAMCGGAFHSSALYLRAASRVNSPPAGRYDSVGFRCTRE